MLKEIGSVFRTLNKIDRALRTKARGHQKQVDAVTTQPTATGRTHLSSIDLQGELWMPDIKWADTLSGVEFERWIAIIFQQEGFHVKTTPGSSDYGADLILEHGESRIVVQTKRYKSKVGVDAVQEVVAAMDYYDAEGAIVITNSTVSRQARALASRQRRTVKIWDRSMLLQLLEHRAKNDSAHQKQTSSNKSGKEENGKRDFGALCKAINENPSNSAVYMSRGVWFWQNREYTLALNDFETAIVCDSRHPNALTYKGITLFQLKQFNDSIAALSMAIEQDKNDPLALYYRGLAFNSLSSFREARSDLLRSAEIYGRQNNLEKQKRSLNALH